MVSLRSPNRTLSSQTQNSTQNCYKTLANTSGGKYYTLEDASQMVNHIPLVESATSHLVDEEVWDMPLIFGCVILLFGLEWLLRKRRGLA